MSKKGVKNDIKVDQPINRKRSASLRLGDSKLLLRLRNYTKMNPKMMIDKIENKGKGKGSSYQRFFENGRKFQGKRKFKKAVKEYERSIVMIKDDKEKEKEKGIVWHNIGLCHENLMMYEIALKDYTNAIELCEGDYESILCRGNVYCGMKRYDKAFEDYEKCIEMKRDYPNPYLAKADLYLKLGRYDESIEIVSKAIEIPDYSYDYGRCLRARSYFKKREFGKAKEDVKYVLDEDKDYFYANFLDGLLKKNDGNLEGAVECFFKVINFISNDLNKAYEIREMDYKEIEIICYEELAFILKKTKRYKESMKMFKKLLKLDPERKRIFKSQISLIKCLLKNPNYIQGKKLIKTAFVVGNSKYKEFDDLPRCLNDAKKMENICRKILNFDYTECHYDLETDNLMESFIKFLQNRLQLMEDNPDSNVYTLFYFSGHGIEIGSPIILPIDFKKEYLEVQYEQRYKIIKNSMNVEKIKRLLCSVNNTSIIILDCCRHHLHYSIDIAESVMSSLSSSIVCLSTGCGKGALASVESVEECSPYTHCLLKRLVEKNVEIEFILKKVKKDVVELTNSVQNPWYLSDLRDSVILNRISEKDVDISYESQIKNLKRRVLELEEENSSLKKDVESWKKKFESK